MGLFYRSCVRPLLFAMDPEEAHESALHFLAWAGRHQTICELLEELCGSPPLPVRLFDLDFPNPIGVAAGLDKQAAAVPAWPCLGFGFTELGGVTRHGQPGNPPPRVFRAPAEGALVNRMGFNNPGAEVLARTLEGWRQQGRWPSHPVGINLGKSKVTPLVEAAEDYAWSLAQLWALADFFVINVSSPNTPNLRQLQDKAALDEIVHRLQTINRERARATGLPPKPLLVKVAPDLAWEALDEILQLAQDRELAGLVATNTTVSRPETVSEESRRVYAESGGLSGRPLQQRSTAIIRHVYRQTRGRLPVIGVGGIFTVEDAWKKITAGATLLQIYTGLVYEGPGLTKRLVSGLRDRIQQAGFKRLAEAVGTAVPGSGQPIPAPESLDRAERPIA